MLQPLSVNRFTILNIEEINTDNSEPTNTSLSFSTPIANTTLWKPK